MKMLVTKMALATSVALATLVATEAAYAQSQRHQAAPQAATEAYDAQGNPHYEFGPRVTVQPNDVLEGDSVIGRDPDPLIRDQLRREYDSGSPE